MYVGQTSRLRIRRYSMYVLPSCVRQDRHCFCRSATAALSSELPHPHTKSPFRTQPASSTSAGYPHTHLILHTYPSVSRKKAAPQSLIPVSLLPARNALIPALQPLPSSQSRALLPHLAIQPRTQLRIPHTSLRGGWSMASNKCREAAEHFNAIRFRVMLRNKGQHPNVHNHTQDLSTL
jgi:hypothetical protein